MRTFRENGIEVDRRRLYSALSTSDFVVLGEEHNNRGQNKARAKIIRDVFCRTESAYLVFEQLTAEKNLILKESLEGSLEDLGRALQWQESGWGEFKNYYPFFEVARDCHLRVFGGDIPKSDIAKLKAGERSEYIGELTREFHLDLPLPKKEQAKLNDLLSNAHGGDLKGGLDADRLAGMVRVQRLRDASMAKVLLENKTDSSVGILITGNVHARTDFGVAYYLARQGRFRVISVGFVDEMRNSSNQFDFMATND